MLPKFLESLTLIHELFEIVAEINEEIKERNSMVHFAKDSNFESIDFLRLFAKLRKSAKKMSHQKKNRGHRSSKIVKSRQSCSNDHLSYLFFILLLRALSCMMWLVNLRAQQGCAETISGNVIKLSYKGDKN